MSLRSSTSIAEAISRAKSGEYRRRHFAQSPENFARAQALMAKQLGEPQNFEFRPNADRYELEGDQYVLDLPKPK